MPNIKLPEDWRAKEEFLKTCTPEDIDEVLGKKMVEKIKRNTTNPDMFTVVVNEEISCQFLYQ